MPSQLSQSTREEVLEAYGRECIFCETHESEHEEEHGRSLDIHHLIPASAGGSDAPENLVPLCISCHQTMESEHGEAMKELAKAEGLDAPPREEYNSLKNKKELAVDELERVKRERDECKEKNDGLSESIFQLLEHSPEVNIHVVHETRLSTSRLLYAGTDEEKAYERYIGAEYHSTMESISIHLGELENILEADSFDTIVLDDILGDGAAERRR